MAKDFSKIVLGEGVLTYNNGTTDIDLGYTRGGVFNDNIVFLRRLVKGGTNKSYGIQVARLAGIPDLVIHNAKHILSTIEHKNNTDLPKPVLEPFKTKAKKKTKKKKKADDNQLELFSRDEGSVKKMLEKIDISSITPLEAINLLNDLKQEALK